MIPLFKVAMRPETADAVGAVLRSGWVAEGPKVEEFERLLVANLKLDDDHTAVTTNSGTSAIELALDVYGVGPDATVISTPMTCAATNLPVLRRGAKLHWADVDPHEGVVTPELLAQAIATAPEPPRAILVVDWGGFRIDLAGLGNAAQGIPLIVDAAHCAPIRNDVRFPGVNAIAYSFQAIKFLTTGDGGALVLPKGCEAAARRWRWFGLDRRSPVDFRAGQPISLPGGKLHMNDVAAAIGIANLRGLEANVQAHRRNAGYYDKRFATLQIGRPWVGPWSDCWLYPIRTPRRDEFIQFMRRRGIECSRVHARNDLHPVFAASTRALPGVAAYDATQVSIPVGWWVSEVDREVIANAVEDWSATLP